MIWTTIQNQFNLPLLREFHVTEGARDSLSDYENRHRSVMSNGMADVTRLYLDTNYWIQMRHAALGSAERTFSRLYDRIRNAVQSRRLTCVFHHSAFMEAAKQDPNSLRAFALVVDELTENTAIAPTTELIANEARAYVATYRGSHYDDEAAKWTRTVRIFRSKLPRTPIDGKEPPEVVYKMALDGLFSLRLTDILKELGSEVANYRHQYSDKFIDALEVEKMRHQNGFKSRALTRVESFREMLKSCYRERFREHLLTLVPTEELEQAVSEIEARAAAEFSSGTLGRRLATGRIKAELHADYLHDDPKSKLTSNTLIDHEHAAAALPHCHAFFTEKNLTHKLVKVTKLAELYGCTVVFKVADAHATLDRFGM